MGMNSDQVLDYLDEIAATSARSIKESCIGAGLGDPLFRAVLVAAYDPFVTYGVTGFELGMKRDDAGTFDKLPAVLQLLATRALTGNAAATALTGTAELYTQKSQELLRRIITKDLRAGFTAGTVNRVEKGMIPIFEVMLAHKFEPKRIKAWPAAVEPKLDGVRVACVVRDFTVDGVDFLSRNGKPFPAVDHMKQQMLDFLTVAGITEPMFFDGEMVTGSFNKTVGDVRRKSQAALDAEFVMFDHSRLSDFKSGASIPDRHRRARLAQIFETVDKLRGLSVFPFRLNERELVNSVEEAMELYNGYRARGLEGAIVKPLDSPYVQKRSHAWLKLKNEETHDLIITDAFEGTGKYVGMLGGVIVDFNGVEVRVGGGFSDQLRAELWSDYKSDKRMFGGSDTNKLIGRMIEVEAHEVTPDLSLRHPRFVRFRDDKCPLAEAA